MKILTQIIKNNNMKIINKLEVYTNIIQMLVKYKNKWISIIKDQIIIKN